MRISTTLFLAGAVLALAWAVSAPAAPEDAAVGAIRAVLPRAGVDLREHPSPLSARTAHLAHGTRLRVEEHRGRWLRVSTLSEGGTAPATGWLRAGEAVEPFALTQQGREGPIQGAAAPVTQAELSAAGRQFDETTEESYRESRPDLQAAYPLVDRIERSDADPEAVRRFAEEGRLGRPEGVR